MARPTIFCEELADSICDKIANGESLRQISKQEGYPTPGTICRWLTIDEQFLKQYTLAKEICAEVFADEIVAIADNEDGEVNRDRLRLDARKWVASKLKPKKYGDKQAIEHSGAVTVERVTFADSDTK